jgi:ABC-type multidrug transport system fused ATPase/permease subunit
MNSFTKLLYFLNPNERRKAVLVLFMSLLTALLDTIGVASILPFVAVLSNPSVVETNALLNTIFLNSINFGVENSQQFLFVLGVFVFLVLISSLIFKAITIYIQLRFVQTCQYSISKRMMEKYLSQPYSWFLNRHSSDLGKTILSEVSHVVANGIRPLVELVSKSLITITIIILLLIVNVKLALMVSLSLGGAYFLIFYLTQKYLSQIGQLRLFKNQLLFKSISEAFSAIKEIKVDGLEQIYVKRFSDPAKTFAQTTTSFQLIGQLPRFVLEAIIFGGILLIILFIMSQTGSFNKALPLISLYAFAGYRLIPALQKMYASIAQLKFSSSSVNKLYDDFKNLKFINQNENQETISFDKKINLKNISYNYPNSSKASLRNINLSILSKSTVGFVGTTGSGKTTTVDIILGLIEAQKGILEIDGKIITQKNVRAWHQSIGYVPQHIFLSDDTIAANIAFGVESKNINYKTVEEVSKIASIHNFISTELPEKYFTTIGERGVRLSGGQRQRIGIARALYNNPKLLILDEATNALDNLTEKAVMDAINNLKKDITIILIAHSLSTVKNCDKIFLIESGKLKNEGTFEELIKTDKDFAKQTMLTNDKN